MPTTTRRTPDMTGKAAEIDNPMTLYARIGYRVFLAYQKGDVYDISDPARQGHAMAELKRLAELHKESEDS